MICWWPRRGTLRRYAVSKMRQTSSPQRCETDDSLTGSSFHFRFVAHLRLLNLMFREMRVRHVNTGLIRRSPQLRFGDYASPRRLAISG